MHCEYIATAESKYVTYENSFRTEKDAAAWFDDLRKQGVRIQKRSVTPVNVGDRLDVFQLKPLQRPKER